MIPKTPQEMQAMIFVAVVTRLYGDVTTEARRRRLTEHDIAGIERRALATLKDGPDFAHEFTTFEAEPVVAKTLKDIEALLIMARAGRLKNIQQK